MAEPILGAAADTGVTTTTTTTTTSPLEETTVPRRSGMWQAGRDQVLDEAKTMVREAADEQRQRAASSVSGMAGALRKVARDLDTENDTMGRYTQMAAERLDEVAQYLRQSDLNDVIVGAENLARRQPWLVIGGAVAAGFVLARLVKAGTAERPYSGVEQTSRRLAASSAAGYGTSVPGGTYPPTATTTSPVTGTEL